jgi:PIN domain nuclease of toxin-antitoxin system
VIHLDTNVALWLSQGREGKLSSRARAMIRRAPAVLSPVVFFELDLLYEQGKQELDGEMVRAKLTRLRIKDSSASMAAVARAASRLSWTREPWDRLIVANAIADGAKLVTADSHIRAHFADAVW